MKLGKHLIFITSSWISITFKKYFLSTRWQLRQFFNLQKTKISLDFVNSYAKVYWFLFPSIEYSKSEVTAPPDEELTKISQRYFLFYLKKKSSNWNHVCQITLCNAKMALIWTLPVIIWKKCLKDSLFWNMLSIFVLT